MTEHSFPADDLPKHIAVIMDGNGRWAKSQGKPRVYGHKMAVTAVRDTISTASRLKIPAITLFAFSQENWKRPKAEVSVLMDLFMSVLTKEVKKLHSHNLRLRVIGDLTRFSPKLQQKIEQAHQMTSNNTGTCINIAANYGGKWDIVEATKAIAGQVGQGKLAIDDINEDLFATHLCFADFPEVDLMIRTSGEYRISNFMLWQMAYSELYFTDLCWPEFNEKAMLDAISWYMSRERRFGCTSEQLQAFIDQTAPKADI